MSTDSHSSERPAPRPAPISEDCPLVVYRTEMLIDGPDSPVNDSESPTFEAIIDGKPWRIVVCRQELGTNAVDQNGELLKRCKMWPPLGWKSNECPVDDSPEAVIQWLDFCINVVGGVSKWDETDAVHDAYLLVEHLKQRGRKDPPLQPDCPLGAAGMVRELKRVRAWLENPASRPESKPVQGDNAAVSELQPVADAKAGKPDTSEDGPTGINGWRYGTNVYSGMQPKPWLLAKALHGAKNKTLDIADAEDAIYGHDNDAPEQGLDGLRSAANRFFRKHRIPLAIAINKATQRVSLSPPAQKKSRRTKKSVDRP